MQTRESDHEAPAVATREAATVDAPPAVAQVLALQRSAGNAATGQMLQRWSVLPDWVPTLTDPLAPAFEAAMQTNRAMAEPITINPYFRQKLIEYSEAHPADGLMLLPALARGPRFFTGGWILDVQTGREQPTPSAPGSDVEVVVRDASGGEVSRTPVLASPLEERTGPQLPPGRFVSAVVPGAGAASVDIVVGGNVVATRSASPSVPQVELRSPGNGDRIGSGGNLAINWSASDGDGGELVSTVEFSADSGRTWKPLGIVRSGGQSLRIARSELPRTNNGELRVTTGDGFNAGSDGVTRLRTAGAKPEVTIVSPPNGTRVRADAPVLLEGSAFDDAGNPIPGRRLEWSSGKKRLGRGESADALAYELGRQVTLQARDSAGRAGSDRIRLRIEKVSPIFTALDARRLGARSKEIDLRVASSLPGTLSVSGKGVRGEREGVGPKEETIEIGIRGSVRDAYALKLKLSAAGKRTSQTLQVDRAG